MKLLTLIPLSFSSSCLWFLLVSSLCSICFSNQNADPKLCIPTERLALIDLKDNLTDEANRLHSWVGKDCCSWSGVVCDNITGHIHEIRLRGPELDEASYQLLGGTISPSLIKLLQLRYLDLSRNDFGFSSIPSFIGSFQNLIYLKLSYSQFSGKIPHQLGNLSALQLLDVSGNYLTGQLPERLGNLKNLIEIDLGFNNLTGNIPHSFGSLLQLQKLHINANQLLGPIPDTIGCLSSLLFLDLSYNKLNGTIPDSLGSLSQLQTLQLNANQFSGLIPNTIGGLSSLLVMDLSENKLNESLPESIGRLGDLRDLSLHHNSLEGNLIENHFANLTSLTTLWVGDNKLVFKVDVNNWSPPFTLQVLKARSCSLGPRFPPWIQWQTDLIVLDISNANISDTIPDWFWSIFDSVTYMNMSHNNIHGKLGYIYCIAPGATLDLSNNHLHGRLPYINTEFFEVLDLSNNNFSGSLEKFLCIDIQEPASLRVLNLANNSMSGTISNCWMNWPFLLILNLEKNQFSGIIPSSLKKLLYLRSLDMDDNKLSGNIPLWLLNSNSLLVVELARNELYGKIPSSIGRHNTSLRVLSLRSNNFEGKIPDEICHLCSLQILDLAHNDLSGNLPTCFTNFSVMSGRETTSPIVLFESTISTASLVTKGNTYTYSTILYLVTSLDLSNNKFSGLIPDELVGLLGLRFLNMSHNDLSGRIPNSFSHIGKLESLDLSKNQLYGNIPSSLSQLTALSWLDVSYNNLVGRIPTGPQLQTFNVSSFTGNALCGAPLPLCLKSDGEGTTDIHDESNGIDWILVILTIAGLVIGFWSILAPLFLSKRWRITYYQFLEEIWFKLQDFIFLLLLRLTRRSGSI